VLFEILTQRWPFEAEALPELCLKVVNDPPLSLQELRPDVPEAMVKVVMTCLEKDRNKRFANAAELATALEPMLPPLSRVVVDRARWALANAPSASPSLRSVPAIEARATPSNQPSPPPRTAPTPAAWGSGKGTSLGSKRRSRILWVGASLFVVLAAGAAMLGLRNHTGETGDVGAADPRVIATAGTPGAVAPPPAQQAPTGPAVTVLAPVNSGELAPPIPPASTSATLAPMASAPPRPSARPSVTMPSQVLSPVLSRPSPPVRPSVSDDDIPALR
jgi:serine/threonine-protein kinase